MEVVEPNRATHGPPRVQGEPIGERVIQDASECGPGGEYEYSGIGVGASERGGCCG